MSTVEAIGLAGRVEDLAVVDLTYPFDPGDLTADDVASALRQHDLQAIAVTPEIYTRRFSRGGFTNPDPKVRREVIDLISEATEVGRRLGCDYIKLWPGQDGWDYPFQVDYGEIWRLSLDGEIGLPNVGILLDFGHSLYCGETPADAARLAISRDRLFAIDVNDNFRGWDDDMVVGSVHLTETFEVRYATGIEYLFTAGYVTTEPSGHG